MSGLLPLGKAASLFYGCLKIPFLLERHSYSDGINKKIPVRSDRDFKYD